MALSSIGTRDGPNGPFTNPGLEVNLFFRVFLGIIAILACWVPGKLLWRNGELAAVAFCVNVTVFNVVYVTNSLIWPNDNISTWWMGYGWCDLLSYVIFPLQTQYAACVLAIMRHLAQQVGLMRASSLTSTEKRRRNLIQALILFPVPLLQVALTYPILAQRYSVLTLMGCVAAYDPSWPYLVFMVLPSPLFTVGAAYYAVVTWKRFRELDRSAREALNPITNSSAARRQQRIRRKLFYMSAAILIPYAPVELLFLGSNVAKGMPWTKPYDFKQIHYGLDPDPWNYIGLATSDMVDFATLNANYITIITVIPIFWCFGMTKEAINTYRRYLLALGLGRVFPKLNEEYDPDISSGTSGSWGNAVSNMLRSRKITNNRQVTSSSSALSSTTLTAGCSRSQSQGGKTWILPTSPQSSHTRTTRGGSTLGSSSAPYEDTRLHEISVVCDTDHNEQAGNPWPDSDAVLPPRAHITGAPALPHRSPWIFHTTAAGPLKLPPLTLSSLQKKKANADAHSPGSAAEATPHLVTQPSSTTGTPDAEHERAIWTGGPGDSAVQTQVWSGYEQHLSASSSSGPAAVHTGNGVTVRTDLARSTEGTPEERGTSQ